MTTINRQVLLARRPQGPVSESDFRIVDAPMPQPADDEVLVRNEWLSLDPYMRGRMSDAKSYVPPAALDAVMVGQTVGEVVTSRDPRFASGDKVLTNLGWQSHGAAKAADLTKVDAQRAPPSYYLGVLGMPGITAWFGLFEIGQPKPGETVVVSAASGAVGSVVGQLAKAHGCRAVGIAGGKAKCDYVVNELKFDACIDYKAGNLEAAIAAACPQGVDVYFDNVGGPVLDAVLTQMNAFSRIALCGQISGYNNPDALTVRNFRSFLVNRIQLRGFICSDHMDLWRPALKELGMLVHEGKLKYRESIAQGLENAPAAFIGLLNGQNFGKQLVKLI